MNKTPEIIKYSTKKIGIGQYEYRDSEYIATADTCMISTSGTKSSGCAFFQSERSRDDD
nr:MAG TPA: hypothetical protein [Caudoviricetes sp.]